MSESALENAAITQIVASAFEEMIMVRPTAEQSTVSPSTLLTGDGGVLTSLEVITFILAVEERVNETLSKQIVLFDEALIADPRGPFRTLGALADHVQSLVRKS